MKPLSRSIFYLSLAIFFLLAGKGHTSFFTGVKSSPVEQSSVPADQDSPSDPLDQDGSDETGDDEMGDFILLERTAVPGQTLVQRKSARTYHCHISEHHLEITTPPPKPVIFSPLS